jgi:hypothetical protein
MSATSRPSLPAAALELLAKSDAELVAATLASEPADRLWHAHMAALRAGAALLHATGRPARRGVRTVWDMVAVAEPELAGRAAFFADNAAARSAVEAGRRHVVDEDRAERAVAEAEDFHAAVRARLGLTPGDVSQLRFAS